MRGHTCLPLALLLLWACGTPTDSNGPAPLLTDLPRDLSPAEIRIVDGANAFAFDLLSEAARALPPDSNVFLSPLSASMALGMALNGANGETLDSMRFALRLSGMAEPDINQSYSDLIALLGGLDPRTEMRIANSIWAHQSFQPSSAFITTGRTFFDAEIRTLDFASPDAVTEINDWVSSETNGRIPQLLDAIAAEEIMFLINAIYFKGKWRSAFDSKDTEVGVFHGADGRGRSAALMRQEEMLQYHETAEYQAVDLLYGNGAFAMTVLLPKDGRSPGDLLANLDPVTWRELGGLFSEVEVNLTLPRFRMEYSRRLNADLTAMGMGVAFDRARADFGRIAEGLFLTRVDQKTFVEVNEEGTEAAAATAVGVGAVSAPQYAEMRVDHPFLFAIRERLSGTLVFLGIANVIGA